MIAPWRFLFGRERDRGKGSMDAGAAPLLRMEGICKRYGGVRALEEAELAGRRRPHPCHPRRERRRQVDADQDHGRRGRARRRPHDARRPRRSRFARSGRRQRGRHRLHLPGAVADPRSHASPTTSSSRNPPHALRPDRPPGAAPRSPRRRWRAPAPRTSIRWRWSRTCRCRAGRWSRSPRRSRASRAS